MLSNQEYLKDIKVNEARNLYVYRPGNWYAEFDTTFTVQEVYLGCTLTFDFRVSDHDSTYLNV